MSALEERVLREVEELHAFFEGWLSGALPKDRGVFARLEEALVPEFEMVVPSGEELGRDVLLKSLWDGHAKSEGLLIRIESCRVLWCDEAGTCLARYEEVHQGPRASRRVSTALFRARGSDRALAWVHVHETWHSDAEITG